MRERLLTRIVAASVHRPKATLAVLAGVTALLAVTLPFLKIQAGHSGMIDPTMPEQARYVAFTERFGSPNQLVVVVEGADEPTRRALVDRLVEQLPGAPAPPYEHAPDDAPRCEPEAAANQDACVADVLGRFDLDRVATRALYYVPSERLEPLVEVLEGEALGVDVLHGFTGLTDAVEAFGGVAEAWSERDPPEGDELERSRSGMAQMAKLAELLTERVLEPDEAAVPIEAAVLGERVEGGLDREGYLSSPDGALKLVVVRPAVELDDPAWVVPFVGYVRQMAERAASELHAERCAADTACAGAAPLSVTLTGLPAVVADEADQLAIDVVLTGVLAALGLFFVILAGFRSLGQTLLALGPLLITLTWALAFTVVAFGGLNLVTAAAVPTLLGLSIDFAVHLLARFNEGRGRGQTPEEAVTHAIYGAGPGLITGALTTAFAFMALGFTDFKGFREMGIITSVGLVGAVSVTFTAIPALLIVTGVGKRPPKAAKRAAEAPSGVARVPDGIVRWARTVSVLGVAATAVLLVLATDIPWSYDYAAMLPEEATSTKAMVRLAEETDFSAEVAAVEASSLAEAEALAAELLALASVARVESLAAYLPPDAQAPKTPLIARLEAPVKALEGRAPAAPVPLTVASVPELAEAVEELGDTLEDIWFDADKSAHPLADGLRGVLDAIRGFGEALEEAPAAQTVAALRPAEVELLDARDRALAALAGHFDDGVPAPVDEDALLARLPPGTASRFLHVAEDGARTYAVYAYPSQPIWDVAWLERFVADLQGISPTATGFPVVHLALMESIRDGFQQAALLALIVLFLMLLFDFRSLWLALLTTVPLATCVALTWGLLSLTDFHYNAGNIVALPLILGIAVDSGVHIVHRFVQEKGRDVASVVRHTGHAVMLSGVTTMAGFGALAMASHKAMASLGEVLLLGVALGLGAAVLFLPALLEVLRRGTRLTRFAPSGE